MRCEQYQSKAGLAKRTESSLHSPLPRSMFVTVDRNLYFQQNLATLPLSVVILEAGSNRLADLKPLGLKVREALNELRPGEVVRVS